MNTNIGTPDNLIRGSDFAHKNIYSGYFRFAVSGIVKNLVQLEEKAKLNRLNTLFGMINANNEFDQQFPTSTQS